MLPEMQIGPNERILWSGTRNKKAALMEGIFNPMLPFAAIWGLFDFGFLSMSASADGAPWGFLIPFFALHLMPVWLYLGGALTAVSRAKNTFYCVTDQAIYIQRGGLNSTFERITYDHVRSVGTHQSFFDKREFTGDVVLKLDEIEYVGKNHNRPQQREVKIENIPDYEELYHTIMQYQAFAADKKSERAALDRRADRQQYDNRLYGYPQAQQYGDPLYGNQQAQQYGDPLYGTPQPQQYGDSLYDIPQPQEYGEQPTDGQW